jgi:chromosome segregation ATPase
MSAAGASDESDAEDNAAALNNIIQPLRKQLKKQAGKIEKLTALVQGLEQGYEKEKERSQELEKQVAELNQASLTMKTSFETSPWRTDLDVVEASLRAAESRLSSVLDEQRVQLAAHAQVFQSTQSSVADVAQRQASQQIDQSDGSRRMMEELRALTTRLDHMRGEFSERVTHTFSESTSHADRLGQRLQEDLHRLDQEVSMRAQSRSVTDSTAALQAELNDMRATNDELRRDLRNATTQLQELREAQQGLATKSAVSCCTLWNLSASHT